MHTIARLPAQELAGLLVDAVDGGASVGFLSPFGYAGAPGGTLLDCSFFFKRLTASA
jgi:hypothetical protein